MSRRLFSLPALHFTAVPQAWEGKLAAGEKAQRGTEYQQPGCLAWSDEAAHRLLLSSTLNFTVTLLPTRCPAPTSAQCSGFRKKGWMEVGEGGI